MPDRETLAFYAQNAAHYAKHRQTASPRLEHFMALLPVAGRVLELGTGNGRDAAALLAAGFDVTPSDASPQLAAEAERRLGRAVRIMAFDELDDHEIFDGVWACAALLHAPRSELTGDLYRIWCALRPGGHLVASFKAGDGEGRDGLGRYYNYPDAAALSRHLANAAAWRHIDITQSAGSGYDGQPTQWLWVHAIRPN